MDRDTVSGDLRFLRRVLIVLGVAVLALFVWRLLDLFLLAFGGVLLAILLRSLADLIARYARLPDGWALAAAILLVSLLLLGAGALFGTEVRAQFATLAEALPQAWESFQDRLGGSAVGAALLEPLSGGSEGGGAILSRLGGLMLTIAGGAADLLLVIFGGVYFAVQPGVYKRGLVALFPPGPVQNEARETVEVCGQALRLWLVGQLIAMVVVATMTTVGLYLVGVKSALALGLLAGLAEFVPIVGPILAAIPGLLIGLSQGTDVALWTLGVYLVVQQLESNMLMPLIERSMVSLPPALLLFAVVAMGILFGPLGVLFATPLTVVLFVIVKKLYVRETLGQATEVPGEDAG